MTVAGTVRRRSVRAVLFDDRGEIVLMKRTKPGRSLYWTTIGGGVEPDDASRESALHREVMEEAGARIVVGPQVFLSSGPSGRGIDIAHYFLCRMISADPALRSGPEFADPSRGGYDVDHLRPDQLTTLDLKPVELRAFVVANLAALMSEVALLG